MVNLKNIEFSDTPGGKVEVRIIDKPMFIFEQRHTDLTNSLIEYICEFYPEAYKSLCEIYAKYTYNKLNYKYRIAHRFIRCNFGTHDSKLDIDRLGNFHFEEVKCPLKGECKHGNILCNPVFNTKLSGRESEVMELYYKGSKSYDIAEALSISIKTVETHKQNSLKKLGLHSLHEFLVYANQNKLFNTI